jgi:hypothetical protein
MRGFGIWGEQELSTLVAPWRIAAGVELGQGGGKIASERPPASMLKRLGIGNLYAYTDSDILTGSERVFEANDAGYFLAHRMPGTDQLDWVYVYTLPLFLACASQNAELAQDDHFGQGTNDDEHWKIVVPVFKQCPGWQDKAAEIIAFNQMLSDIVQHCVRAVFGFMYGQYLEGGQNATEAAMDIAADYAAVKSVKAAKDEILTGLLTILKAMHDRPNPFMLLGTDIYRYIPAYTTSLQIQKGQMTQALEQQRQEAVVAQAKTAIVASLVTGEQMQAQQAQAAIDTERKTKFAKGALITLGGVALLWALLSD